MEQNKIPEFFDEKGKDSSMAKEFIRCIDALMGSNAWAEAVAYNHFAYAL
jgi:hypothetical protein